MFIPAADFSYGSLLTPARILVMRFGSPTTGYPTLGYPSTNPDHKGIAPLKNSNPDSVAAKIVKRQLPRARKARARLRLQNKLRVAVARNN
jgi:hypothetical protein